MENDVSSRQQISSKKRFHIRGTFSGMKLSHKLATFSVTCIDKSLHCGGEVVTVMLFPGSAFIPEAVAAVSIDNLPMSDKYQIRLPGRVFANLYWK